jgi:hypothetical protein
MKILRFFPILLLMFQAIAIAAPPSPADVAREYNTFFFTQQFAKAIALHDTDDLKILRLNFQQLLSGQASPAAQRSIFGERSEKEIASLSDAAYVEAFYSATADTRIAGEKLPSSAEVAVLGTAYDGENTAYVTCKNTISVGELLLEYVDLVRLKKVDGLWRVGAPADLIGMTEALAKRTNQSPVDFLTENEAPPDGEIRVLDNKPENAVVVDRIVVEFLSTAEDRKPEAVRELKRRAYILAAHAIAEIEIEEEPVAGGAPGGTYKVTARASALVFKKR